MSYRAVWGKVKATEERLGRPLLTKRTGGAHGGGSELTPFARSLIARFRHLENLVRATSDTLFQGVFLEALEEKPPATENAPPASRETRPRRSAKAGPL
jgi:molybdate transport system regulatory protein